MNESIFISKTVSIRECGRDEYWLQDQIFENPSILGLGDLEVVEREKKQSSGGKLDLLLKDPEDDSMYEVEVMLGATDESHIIRAIEYWDLERRRWPQRRHTAVLVAESITRRFFNVIQLLSMAVPVVAIQGNVIEAEGKKILHFTRVLDAYEEPEEAGSEAREKVSEADWLKKAPLTVEASKTFLRIVQKTFPALEIGYVKSYIGFYVGNDKFFDMRRHGENKTLLRLWAQEPEFSAIKGKLDENGLAYTLKGQTGVRLLVDKEMIEKNAAFISETAGLVKQSWKA